MKISSYQFFILIVMFELGSAIVLGLGMQAKEDAWIAILLGMLVGILIFAIYANFIVKIANKSLLLTLQQTFGQVIGSLVGFIYISYFIYLAGRVLRDFGDLLGTSILSDTPLVVINSMIMIIIIYAGYKGFELYGRLGEIFFPFTLLLGVIMNVLLYFSGVIKIENLLPILNEGWKPVLNAVFPLTVTFPFGEMIVFTMLFQYLQSPNKAVKIGIFAMLFSGIILSYVVATDIAVLGAFSAGISFFPLLQSARLIEVDFLQRLDLIAVLVLFITGYFKIAIFNYAAVLGVSTLFKEKQINQLIIPIGVIVLITSIIIAESFPDHLDKGLKIVPYYLHIPLQIVIPLLLVTVGGIRYKWNNRIRTKNRTR